MRLRSEAGIMARVYDPIIDLERAAAKHWRGTEEEWLGGWLLRAAEGFTGRANSALPLGDPGLPLDGALDAVIRWYRDRGLPPMIVVPLPLDADSPRSSWSPTCPMTPIRSVTTRPENFRAAPPSG
jgi:hypothetical protein